MYSNGTHDGAQGYGVFQWTILLGFLISVLLATPRPVGAQITRNTVGPDGAFATIQNAIWSCPNSGECHVDVQAGQTFTENVSFMTFHTGGKIVMTGGWDSTFSSREENHRLSTIDGGGTGRVLEIQVSGTHTLEIEGFIIENGIETRGAGIDVSPTGYSNAVVKLTNLDIRNNHAIHTDESTGGGIGAYLDGSERLEIVRCEIHSNSVTVTSSGNYAGGGGIAITATDTASFLVDDTWVEENTSTSNTTQKLGAGQRFSLGGDASGEVLNMRVSDNTAGGTNLGVSGTGGNLYLEENASLVVRRCVWAGNNNLTGGADGEQLRIQTYDNTTLLLTDSGVVLGDQDGLAAVAYDAAQQQYVNLSVGDNTARGISVNLIGSSTASLYNSIAYGNGTDVNLSAGVTTGNNLIGVDPVWVAPGPPSYNYHLDEGSPALNAGDNSPPGGLGALDLDGLPRIQDSIVDIGCYEGAGRLFADGFESGGTGEWSTTAP
jgi:hypothetical protein